jgi:hypothetical protein
MIFVRFTKKGAAPEMKGIMEKNAVRRIHGSFFGQYIVTAELYKFEEILFLPPVYPRTIFCAGRGGIPSYIKSVSSLQASDIVHLKHDSLLCIPRIGMVVKEKGPLPFGICPLLDFTPEGGGAQASADGYTVARTVNTDIQDVNCAFRGQQAIVKADELVSAMKTAAAHITLIAGDIVALPAFSEPFMCTGGDKLTLKAAETIEVTLI